MTKIKKQTNFFVRISSGPSPEGVRLRRLEQENKENILAMKICNFTTTILGFFFISAFGHEYTFSAIGKRLFLRGLSLSKADKMADYRRGRRRRRRTKSSNNSSRERSRMPWGRSSCFPGRTEEGFIQKRRQRSSLLFGGRT